MITTRSLLRWQLTNARRSRAGVWTASWFVALVAGGLLAALVWWRGTTTVTGASHAWLAGAVAAFALAFMRVPFHLYWRSDAALLAQLPIEGRALFDVAMVRCIAAAAATFVATVIGAIPLALLGDWPVNAATRTLKAMPIAGDPVPHLTPFELFARHVGLAGVLAVAAAALLPAAAAWAASLVATGGSARAVNIGAAVITGSPGRAVSAVTARAPSAAGTNAGAVLGALPGFASTAVFVAVLIETSWLVNSEPRFSAPGVFGTLIVASIVAILAMRASAARVMGTILRDVSALDRQRLATLEIHPPTAIERAVAKLLGEAGLPYRKDARLMRRRYPMAFALGALAFLVLVIVGLARPGDPVPWLVVVLAGGGMYAIALLGRLYRPPIELPRLAATLPIAPRARTRAKLAWLGVWKLVFLAVPAAFALIRVL